MLLPTDALDVTTAKGLEVGDVIVHEASGARKLVTAVGEPREGLVWFQYEPIRPSASRMTTLVAEHTEFHVERRDED